MSFETSLDEYTKEEVEKNGNGVYGGKRHDEIIDYLEETFKFNDEQLVDISVGVWMAIESEKRVQQNRINELEKKNHELSLALKGYYPLNDFIQARGIDAKNLGRNYGDIAVDKINELEKQLEEAEEVISFYTDSLHPDYNTSKAREYFKNKEKV